MGKTYAYCRVSTKDQNMKLQTKAMKEFGVDAKNIFKEKVTGIRVERPELARMLEKLKPGDKVVVWKLDRLGRSVNHLVKLMEQFEKEGIEFVSIQDKIDTTTSMGRFVFNILASVAQLESDMISERTKAGLAATKKRGRKGGRGRVSPKRIDTALSMYDSKQYSINQICESLDISKSTLYNYIRMRDVK